MIGKCSSTMFEFVDASGERTTVRSTRTLERLLRDGVINAATPFREAEGSDFAPAAASALLQRIAAEHGIALGAAPAIHQESVDVALTDATAIQSRRPSSFPFAARSDDSGTAPHPNAPPMLRPDSVDRLVPARQQDSRRATLPQIMEPTATPHGAPVRATATAAGLVEQANALAFGPLGMAYGAALILALLMQSAGISMGGFQGRFAVCGALVGFLVGYLCRIRGTLFTGKAVLLATVGIGSVSAVTFFVLSFGWPPFKPFFVFGYLFGLMVIGFSFWLGVRPR